MTVASEAIMTTVDVIASSVLAATMVVGIGTVDRAITQDMFADTRAVIEFQRGADAYAFTHRQVERRIGMAHRRTAAPADIDASELAAGIIAERPRPVVLFTPAVVAVFRDAASRALRAGCHGGELRTGLWELRHETYSPAAGTRQVSACMIAALPALPDELEYRSAGTVLLLVDWHAELVVDVLPALLAGSDIR